MEKRIKESYKNTLYDFVEDILVQCPACNQKAVVKTGNFKEFNYTIDEVALICSSCGYSKKINDISQRRESKQKKGLILKFGDAIDPFFHCKLWLQMDFRENVFWAYNLKHLELIEAHVHATLRERNEVNYNVRSIGARLPRWISSAKHRDEILKLIQKLKYNCQNA